MISRAKFSEFEEIYRLFTFDELNFSEFDEVPRLF